MPCVPGERLSAPGPYRKLIQRMASSDPRFRQLDPKKIRQNTEYPGSCPRVVAIQHPCPGEEWRPPRTFREGDALRRHLGSTTGKPNQRWTYLLEGLGPDFVRHLGEHFDLHPAIFFDHERVVVFDSNPRSGENDSVALSSILCTRDHYTLKYYETLYMYPSPTAYRMYCKHTGRQIAATRFNNEFSNVGIARRKCSFWSKKYENGSWDCLVICDPPLNEIGVLPEGKGQVEPQFSKPTAIEPFQAGYRDFVPEKDQLRTGQGPPRTCMVDDLLFYIRTHSSTVGNSIEGPELVSLLVKKLVACHYSRLGEYLRCIFSMTQRNYQRQSDFSDDDRFGVQAAEKQWSDIQTWERRMGEYCSNIEAAMAQLRIPLVEFPDPSAVESWTETNIDYQCLYLRFRELRRRVECINVAVTGLTGIAGNRQACREQIASIIEARNTRALTTLGFIFLPLVFAAGLLSMDENFLPGGRNFWKYWVIAVPLMYVFMLIVRIGIHWGYSDHSTSWSFRTLWGNMPWNRNRALQGKANDSIA